MRIREFIDVVVREVPSEQVRVNFELSLDPIGNVVNDSGNKVRFSLQYDRSQRDKEVSEAFERIMKQDE